jgi:Ca2+-binding RTX toxin-like protein
VSWLIDGGSILAQPVYQTNGLHWSIIDTQGDYNGDGRSDILWRNHEGLISTWLMNGDAPHTLGVRTPMPPNWTLVDGHGDYNGDGKSDLLWRGPNGEVATWLIDGNTIVSQPTYGTLPLGWNITEEMGVPLTGDGAANVLSGTVAANTLRGLGGSDTLIGYGGGDRFVFDTALNAATNVDTVRDFKSGQDKLLLSDLIFSNLGRGALAAGEFVASAGAYAQEADDHVLYDTTTGVLSYDADANGPGLPVAFATLFGHPTLSASDLAAVPV